MADPKVPQANKEKISTNKSESDSALHIVKVMDENRVKLLLSRLRSIPTENEFKNILEQIRQEEKTELEAHVPQLDEKYINHKCDEAVKAAQEELVELKERTLQGYLSLHNSDVYDLDSQSEVPYVSEFAINFLKRSNISRDDLGRLKVLIKENAEKVVNSGVDPNAEDGFIKIAEKIIKSRHEMTLFKSVQPGVKEVDDAPKKTPHVK